MNLLFVFKSPKISFLQSYVLYKFRGRTLKTQILQHPNRTVPLKRYMIITIYQIEFIRVKQSAFLSFVNEVVR